MGFYILGQEIRLKADYLIQEHNAVELHDMMEVMSNFSAGNGVVCVVDNHSFEAAAIVTCHNDIVRYERDDGRSKRWLALDLDWMLEMADFPKDRYEGPRR